MMMYVNAFAGTLSNLEKKLDYVQECNVNYLHLMPLLESPKGRSDGGYAVADFRKVQEELGNMDDFAHLTSECHKRGISVCLDFVMNTLLRIMNGQNVHAPVKENIRTATSSLTAMIFRLCTSRPAHRYSRPLHLETSHGWMISINML